MMADLPGRIAAVIATRRAACDDDEQAMSEMAPPELWPAEFYHQVAERRAYLTALENIATLHVEWGLPPRVALQPPVECAECGEGVAWPCPTLGYVAAALGISP
jgi:hypothetical protein